MLKEFNFKIKSHIELGNTNIDFDTASKFQDLDL